MVNINVILYYQKRGPEKKAAELEVIHALECVSHTKA
jgi:hypothetical protein